MRVATMNVNGLRAAVKKGVLPYLAGRDLDVVTLQEVRAQPEQLPELPHGYVDHWNTGERAGYSGVGVLSRSQPAAVETGIGHVELDAEGRVLLLRYPAFDLVSVYVPSGTTGNERQAVKMSFLDAFGAWVRERLETGRELLLTGDFNIAHTERDLARPKQNQTTSGFLPEERAWLSGFLELGLHDVVREQVGPGTEIYSWWTYRAGARQRNIGWRLDYQLATPGLAARATSAEIPREPVFSDHAPVIVTYDLEPSVGP